MPKTPILDRTLFYDKLPDGTLRLLDFALVNTSVGACVEPVPVAFTGDVDGTNERDHTERSFNRIEEFDEDTAFRLLGTGIQQLPSNYR